MDLKKILKTIKLHEQEISTVLGILILVIAGVFVIRYLKNLNTQSISQKASSTQNQEITHTVTKGETLWSISKKYLNDGNEWKKIADANNITNPQKLEIGQNLVIPEVQPSTEPSNTPVPQITQEAASTNVSTAITGTSYIVVRGDNLWNIAVRAYDDGFRWVEIARANHLKNPNLIHRGNVFIIPR